MSDREPDGPRRPFQFGLASLMLVMLLVGILAAALGGMLRPPGSAGVRMPPGFFILMAVAAPLVMTVLLSLFRLVRNLLDRDRRRRQ